jgi:DNA-binding HxlR family transcriptional regulator
MKRSSFSEMACPLAQTMEHLGDGWTVLVLREAFYGASRFDEFKTQLGIASNTLTRVIKDLVESGILERRPYSEKPPRFDYVLTAKGRDLRPVMLTLLAWGNAHGAANRTSVKLTDTVTGEAVDLQLVDKNSGKPIGPDHKIVRHIVREGSPRTFAFPDVATTTVVGSPS